MSARVIIEVRHDSGVTRVDRDVTHHWGTATYEEIVAGIKEATTDILRVFTSQEVE